MSRLFNIILLIVALTCDANGQVKYRQQRKFKEVKGANDSCIYINKYSATRRRQFYPFNESETIKLVSFRYHRHNYPFKNDSLITDSLIEQNTLNKTEVNSLTDIFYNNFYKRTSGIGSETMCFFPRNAILFMDKNGKMKEYILICFHCNEYELSSEKITMGSKCDQKMELLRQFFISSGLKFGTDPTINVYPGEETAD